MYVCPTLSQSSCSNIPSFRGHQAAFYAVALTAIAAVGLVIARQCFHLRLPYDLSCHLFTHISEFSSPGGFLLAAGGITYFVHKRRRLVSEVHVQALNQVTANLQDKRAANIQSKHEDDEVTIAKVTGGTSLLGEDDYKPKSLKPISSSQPSNRTVNEMLVDKECVHGRSTDGRIQFSRTKGHTLQAHTFTIDEGEVVIVTSEANPTGKAADLSATFKTVSRQWSYTLSTNLTCMKTALGRVAASFKGDYFISVKTEEGQLFSASELKVAEANTNRGYFPAPGKVFEATSTLVVGDQGFWHGMDRISNLVGIDRKWACRDWAKGYLNTALHYEDRSPSACLVYS
ncbi:MAG: hypothetical protein S4CHLAM81_09640 [Chlamydiales bacterium]|nr:hypothetical protein [Chlamydiales bacterium]MCH9635742.1 hypothetical protein [Chlamydiales bacterium]MCH9703789.1 hypothetical protein [Chlamydiota bacterium]